MARIGLAAFAVASIAVLFFSYFGPALDHHFAERLPQHTHIYLGDSGPGHTHPFETEHSHDIAADESAPHDHSQGRNGTIYLSSDDQSGPNSYDSGSTYLTRLMTSPPFDPLRSTILASESDPRARSIPPAVRPPRI